MSPMKKWFILIVVLMLCAGITSCSGGNDPPATLDKTITPEAPMPSPQGDTSVADVATAEELRIQIGQYRDSGEYDAMYTAAMRLIEISPDEVQAYTGAAEALLAISRAKYAEIGGLLNEGCQSTGESATLIAEWAKQNVPDIEVNLPFQSDYTSSDEINADGITTGNLSNAMKINYAWRGGLMTCQGDWIYFSRIDENFSIYKMQVDGSDMQKVGQENGVSINVVGDWIYYISTVDNKSYKMRTDGSMRTKICDDVCGFLSVSGNYIYFDNGSDEGCLYRMETDGNAQLKLSDVQVIIPCVCGNWVYYTAKCMEGGLWRRSVDGGDPQFVAEGIMAAYCVQGDSIYYLNADNPYAVYFSRNDGSAAVEVFRSDDPITTMNLSGNTLLVSMGRYVENDGILFGDRILAVDLASGQILREIEQHTDPLCVCGSKVFFTEFDEGMTWYGVDMENSDSIIIE